MLQTYIYIFHFIYNSNTKHFQGFLPQKGDYRRLGVTDTECRSVNLKKLGKAAILKLNWDLNTLVLDTLNTNVVFFMLANKF